ncbi:MAG: type I restriction enzyme HsdR N-terminal domain-containing protein [Oscillospiraceae bacterium]|nr:type I restriction enzyme HsdR N-terminal domain-containing protein [Oscillospiraceae bacterium]
MYFKAVNSQKLPEIYRRNGKDCYLDNIRQKMIIITPEETIRQKVIGFLINDLNVPSEMIHVEEHIAEYGADSKLRADIVIRKVVEGMERVLAIVECKAPNVAIDDKGIQQLQNYCRLIDAEYSMITNGSDFRFYYFDEKDFQEMDDFPDYEEMLDGIVYEYTPPAPFKRIPFEQMDEFIRRFNEYRYVVGSSSNFDIEHIGINLYECFMDTKHKMPEGKYQLFTLIKDYGVRNLTYGDANGGHFNGNYRSFLIKYKKNIEFVSLSISSYSTYAKPTDFKTALFIAIDDEKSAHHSLQYTLDKSIVIEDDGTVKFYHDGRMAVGNIGSAKTSDLQALVKKRYPSIIDEDGICLGKLKMDRLWRLDLKRVINVMENMISYALIRDELRKKLKKQRAEETVANGS